MNEIMGCESEAATFVKILMPDDTPFIRAAKMIYNRAIGGIDLDGFILDFKINAAWQMEILKREHPAALQDREELELMEQWIAATATNDANNGWLPCYG